MKEFAFFKKMKSKGQELNRSVSQFASKEHASFFMEDTVFEALEKLRREGFPDKIIYFYVVDEQKALKGVVPTRKLLLANPESKIKEIMEESVIHLRESQTLKQALETFAFHKLLALPVVDKEGKLLGVVDVELYMEEAFDVKDSSHRREVFQLLGFTLEEKASTWRSYKLRMPWLFCNMVGGFACAIISQIHEIVIGKFLVLAMFIPLVLTLSESVSMQSMTQSLQFLRKAQLSIQFALKKIIKEWKTVVFLSLTSGGFVGAISLLWGEGALSSCTIGLGIFVSVLLSSSFGTLIPILLHALRLDPKVASGPVVLMFADVLTTFFYLSLATYWLL